MKLKSTFVKQKTTDYNQLVTCMCHLKLYQKFTVAHHVYSETAQKRFESSLNIIHWVQKNWTFNKIERKLYTILKFRTGCITSVPNH